MYKVIPSLILFTYLAGIQLLSAQENLVRNPSFETLTQDNGKLDTYGLLEQSLGWSSPHQGEPAIYTTVDGAIFDYNGSSWPFQARTGENVAGITVYGNSGFAPARDYIQGELIQPLEVGKTYEFSFFVHYHCSGSNNIGITFVPEALQLPGRGLINLIPATYQKEVANYDQKNTWAKVEGRFVAQRPYQHFIIGNFFSNDQTQLEPTSYGHYYAYIDDVSVIPSEVPMEPIAEETQEADWIANDEKIEQAQLLATESTSSENPQKMDVQLAEEPSTAPEDLLEQLLSNNGPLYFQSNSINIDPASIPFLEQLATQLLQAKDQQLELHGHASSEGNMAFNQDLSLKRAQAVAQFLEGKGVPASQLILLAYGEKQLAVAEKTEADREKNRRVAFQILKK